MPDVREVVERVAAELGPGADPSEIEAAAARVLGSSGSTGAPVMEAVLGVSLADCSSRLFSTVRTHVYDKIRRIGSHLAPSFESLAAEAGIAAGAIDIMTTPLALAAPAATSSDFVALAADLDEAAAQCRCRSIGGFSAETERHVNASARRLLAAVPDTLKSTKRVSASLHCGSAHDGLNVDAVRTAAELWTSEVDARTLASRFSFLCNSSREVPGAPDGVVRIRMNVSPFLDFVAAEGGAAAADELMEIAVRSFFPLSASAARVGKDCAEALRRRSGLDVVFDGLELFVDGISAWHNAAMNSLLKATVAGSLRGRAATKHMLLALEKGTTHESITAAATHALVPALESSRPLALHVFIGGNAESSMHLPGVYLRAVDHAPGDLSLKSGHIPPGRLAL